jgi:NADH-quinone oxidoreductase subunit A
VDYRALGIYGLISMFVFLGILIVGYVWLYRKGALEWL